MDASALVRSLLAKRGIESEEEIASFLNPDYEAHTHDPFLLAGMNVAVSRLLSAIEAQERIAVYADFDCDGIPGAALLADFFRKIGHDNFEVYLPHRDREGYGFHVEAIAELASRGAKLIVTVDVGGNALAQAGYAKQLGIDVVITDHHEIGGTLPEAVAVLNPKIAPYPFPHLCGAAVAFKFVQAALAEGKRRGMPAFARVPPGWEKWLLDLVAIATVADMVPLLGENRALAHWGLRVLRKSQRPGIAALVFRLRLRKRELTEEDIGFSLAPRINAASRMDDPRLALDLLTTRDAIGAENLALRLESLNASRKGVVARLVRDAKMRVRARYAPSDRVVVAGNLEWKPALLGLAANSLLQERGGVVCLWGRDATGNLKGSCRSDDSVSIADLFANARDMFEECGGHARSGGFSVSHERVHELPKTLQEADRALAVSREAALPRSGLRADMRMALSEISRGLFEDVARLAPFGVGNPKPVFLFGQCVVRQARRFGKEGSHIELSLECRRSGAKARAYQFFKSPEQFSLAPSPGAAADVFATIERDSFRGDVALRIVDIVPAS